MLGRAKQPIWALNVLAHPRIVVEYEARIFEAIIEPLSSVDADARLAQRAQDSEQLQQYLANAAPRRSLFLKSVKSNRFRATAASTREKRVHHPIRDGGLSSKRPAV